MDFLRLASRIVCEEMMRKAEKSGDFERLIRSVKHMLKMHGHKVWSKRSKMPGVEFYDTGVEFYNIGLRGERSTLATIYNHPEGVIVFPELTFPTAVLDDNGVKRKFKTENIRKITEYVMSLINLKDYRKYRMSY